MRIAAALVLVCLLFASSAIAQSPTATVTGRVLDPNNAVIAAASVKIVNLDTNGKFSTATNDEGMYVVPDLAPGPYRIEVTKPGFKATLKPDVILHVQDVIAINFTLQVGATSESITVQGGAPLVDTQSGSLSTVVDREFVQDIPLNGRSFQDLIQLTPGVTAAPGAQPGSQGEFSVNGQRTESNYYTVDGLVANSSAKNGTNGIWSML